MNLIICFFDECYYVTKSSSPDCNGNPFYFFFKNEKIAMESWK